MRDPKFYRITDYDHKLLPSPLLARLEAGATHPEIWTKQSGLSPGHPSWGILYHMTLAALDPEEFNFIVETGTNWGCSTTVLAQALIDSKRPGRCATVEIDPKNRSKALEHFAEAGVAHMIDSYEGDSTATLPEMIAKHATIRIAYLDGCHDMDHVMKEFALVHPKLAPGGIILLDNTMRINDDGEDPRVYGAIHEIMKIYGGNVINLPFTSWYTPGLAIWQNAPFPAVAGR